MKPNNIIYPPEMKSDRDRKIFKMGWDARIMFIVQKATANVTDKRRKAASRNGAKGGRPRGQKNKPGHLAGRKVEPRSTITIGRTNFGPNDNGI